MEGAQTLLLNALAQTDVDMNFHRLLNWDNSNVPPPPIVLPPTIQCPPNNWINGWNQSTMSWSIAQPGYDNLLRPTMPLDFGLQRVTALANPIAQTDAVNLRTLANAIAQIPLTNPKAAVDVASTGPTDYPRLGGLPIIDGYQVDDGDRVLLKDQGDLFPYENTIWIAHAGVGSWTVAQDVNSVNPNNVCGASVIVLNGNTQQGSGWVNVNRPPIIPGQTPLSWVLYFPAVSGGGGLFVQGPGINITGNTISAVGTPNRITIGTGIDIASNYAGQSSITILGTIAAGTWQGGIIMPQFGGTGQANTYQIALGGNLSTKLAAGVVTPCPLDITLHAATQMDFPVSAGSYYPIPPMSPATSGKTLSNDGVHLLWAGSIPPSIPSDNIQGTTTNDNAAAGMVGEFLSSSASTASPQNIVTVAAQRLFTLTIPPGDWDVRGQVNFIVATMAANTAATMQADIGPMISSIGSSGYESYAYMANITSVPVSRSCTVSLVQRRVSLATQTTFFLVAQTSAGGGAKASGFIEARRVR